MQHTITMTARDFVGQLDILEAMRHSQRLAEISEIRKAFNPIRADIEALRNAGINILDKPTAAYISKSKNKLILEIKTSSTEEMRTAIRTLNSRGFIEVDSLSNYAHALEREQVEILITQDTNKAVIAQYKKKEINNHGN